MAVCVPESDGQLGRVMTHEAGVVQNVQSKVPALHAAVSHCLMKAACNGTLELVPAVPLSEFLSEVECVGKCGVFIFNQKSDFCDF